MSALQNAPDTDWRSRGLCVRPSDVDWHPDKGTHKGTPRADYQAAIAKAKAACLNDCDVLDQCRAAILRIDEGALADGVIAGMDGDERRAAHQEWAAAEAAKQSLTPRQKAVLRYRRAGMTNVEIAALMGVDQRNVERDVTALRAGGHNLNPLKAPTVRGACGTTAGRKAHGANGERQCPRCSAHERDRKAKGAAA